MSISVGLVGATGYTGLEVAKSLLRHPQASLAVATARADAGKFISDVHPSLSGRCELVLEELDSESIAKRCDVVLCCLPHAASAATVKELSEAGTRIVDFSADFRLSSLATYEHWYDVRHPWPEKVGDVVYGLPEFYADQIRDASIVANPGCYPTSAILPLAPLINASLISPVDIIIDSKSGVSGAGRSPKVATLFCETNESINAYSVGNHRHQPEIEDLLERLTGKKVGALFTPHLTPMTRGILSTIYVRAMSGTAGDNVQKVVDCWRQVYQGHPFISAVDHLPATGHVSGTNFVQMSVRAAGERMVIVCAIDNLVKGASGAAIQNVNVMFGLPQETGLL
ncbi:MAG: N-acetyl-gamma-glutamyl-phosphate reductase [Planctomycetota bacterium]